MEYLNDLFVFDENMMEWKSISYAIGSDELQAPPSRLQRAGHSLILVEENSSEYRCLLFGGMSSNEYWNDVIFVTITNSFQATITAGNSSDAQSFAPSNRAFHSALQYGSLVFMYANIYYIVYPICY